MIPYVQREIFRAFEQVAFSRALRAVGYLGEHWGNELRCHELARAIHKLLDINALSFADGKLGAVEHTWLELIVPIAEFERGRAEYQHAIKERQGYSRKVIIDVYVPGRLPQVQLIDPFPLLPPLYVSGEVRTDINHEIVKRAHDEMRDAWLAAPLRP